MTNTIEIMAYRELLRLALDWRGLDGDVSQIRCGRRYVRRWHTTRRASRTLAVSMTR
jgi:hypothetical protein